MRFAFGAYSLTAARAVVGIGLPQLLRPVISVLVVAAFVGLNLSGVQETGLFEAISFNWGARNSRCTPRRAHVPARWGASKPSPDAGAV